MVGAPARFFSPVPGSVYVFGRAAGTWTQQQELLAADGAANDSFGTTVALDGDTALIGAVGDNDNGTGSGSAYVFTRIGCGSSRPSCWRRTESRAINSVSPPRSRATRS